MIIGYYIDTEFPGCDCHIECEPNEAERFVKELELMIDTAINTSVVTYLQSLPMEEKIEFSTSLKSKLAGLMAESSNRTGIEIFPTREDKEV